MCRTDQASHPPPEGWNDGETLPQAFSALASRGITNLEGRLLLALFPTGQPFFRLKPATKFKFDPEVDPSLLQSFEDKLRIHEMIMLAKLEKDDSDGGTNARRAGFRSRMRSAISQPLVTGDVLIQMTDEYQIRIHRRDNYVVRRSTSGDVMYMITREQVDSLSLSPEQIEMIGLDLETEMNTPAYDRMQDLYTKCEWNPMSKRLGGGAADQRCDDRDLRGEGLTVLRYPVFPAPDWTLRSRNH